MKMYPVSEADAEKLFNELDEMLDNGTAEIVTQNDDMMIVRRADGSGVMFANLEGKAIIANIKHIGLLDDNTDANDILKGMLTVFDRKPTTQAADLLSQVFEGS